MASFTGKQISKELGKLYIGNKATKHSKEEWMLKEITIKPKAKQPAKLSGNRVSTEWVKGPEGAGTEIPEHCRWRGDSFGTWLWLWKQLCRCIEEWTERGAHPRRNVRVRVQNGPIWQGNTNIWDLNPFRDRIREVTRPECWRGRQARAQEGDRAHWTPTNALSGHFQAKANSGAEFLQHSCRDMASTPQY